MSKVKATTTYKLIEVASVCGVDQQTIEEFINSEWINPVNPDHLEFDEEDIERIKLIWELKVELGANDESIPIILHLIDELNHLHLGIKKQTLFF